MQINDAIIASKIRTYASAASAGTDSPRPPAQRPPSGRPRTDSVALSDTTQDLLRFQDLAAGQPDVRADRVTTLRSAIANGSYTLDPDVLAARMLGWVAE